MGVSAADAPGGGVGVSASTGGIIQNTQGVFKRIGKLASSMGICKQNIKRNDWRKEMRHFIHGNSERGREGEKIQQHRLNSCQKRAEKPQIKAYLWLEKCATCLNWCRVDVAYRKWYFRVHLILTSYPTIWQIERF